MEVYKDIKRLFGKRIKKFIRSRRGNHFDNAGAVTQLDYKLIMQGIDQVKPRVFIEIGTGKGVSTENIFTYLNNNYPDCEFYTIDIFKEHYNNILNRFKGYKKFHALLGLSVLKEETTDPAFTELKNYDGPQNVLRSLLENELKHRQADIAFIDSRKGSALSEFLLLLKYMNKEGIIFCHDILNRGKGVEVLTYIQKYKDKFDYDIIDTGPAGMLVIRLRLSPAGSR
jgi:predicted O-methyltransferase YrrM